MTSQPSAPAPSTSDELATRQQWLALVDDLVAGGRAVEAVDRLRAQIDAHPDDELERRMVRLRHQAFIQLPEASGRTPWPPVVDDIFVGETGLPEVAAADLTVEALAAGITHHGALLVRGLVGPERAAELVDGIDRALAACREAERDGRDAAGPYFGLFEPVPPYDVGAARSWIWESDGVWVADSPRMLAEVVEVMEESGVGDVLTAYMGERPALSVKKCTLRRMGVDTFGEWHQDGAFLGDEIRTVNVWLTLTHCGDDAPGLDLVPQRMDRILETGTEGAIFDWSVGPGTVEQVVGPAGVLRPVFEVGDALFFDQRFLHSTAADPSMSGPRYAIESWFFAPSHYPHDQVPVYFLNAVDDLLAASDERLAADGALATVAWLRDQNRSDPQPQLERRLLELRHLAFAELADAEGRDTWPPLYPDLFAGQEGMVEVPAAELTAEAIGAGITHHGALLVRGLVTPDEASQLIEATDAAFAAADARNAGAPLADTATWYAPFNAGDGYSITLGERGWVRDGGGLWTADSPRGFWRLTEIFTRARLGEVLAGYLGERPALSVNKGTLRRVPVDTLGEWHQDGAFLGDQIRTVNVWLALSHCGDTAPGLDVVGRRLPTILETGGEDALFNWSVGPTTVDRVKGPLGVLRPVFEAGDALLFDERFLHRTAADPSMTEERYAIESWFFAPSHYPADQIPVVF